MDTWTKGNGSRQLGVVGEDSQDLADSANGDPPSIPADLDRMVSGFVEGALTSVLETARRSTTELVERARQASLDHVAESERLHREAEDRSARLAAYRDRVESMVREVYGKVEGVRSQVREIPGRMSEALSPLTEALVALESATGELSEALRPPGDDPDPDRPRGLFLAGGGHFAQAGQTPEAKGEEGSTSDDSFDQAPSSDDEADREAGSEPEASASIDIDTDIDTDAEADTGNARPVFINAPPEDDARWTRADASDGDEADGSDEADGDAPRAYEGAEGADQASRRRSISDIDWNDLPGSQAS